MPDLSSRFSLKNEYFLEKEIHKIENGVHHKFCRHVPDMQIMHRDKQQAFADQKNHERVNPVNRVLPDHALVRIAEGISLIEPITHNRAKSHAHKIRQQVVDAKNFCEQ